MESMIQGRNSLSNNSTEENDLSNYSYVPESLLKEVLDRLTRIPPPTMNASLRFNVQENSMALIEIIRKEPLNGMPEHISNGMEWALPTLISWLPLDNIVWLLSMLMCEVKVPFKSFFPSLLHLYSCSIDLFFIYLLVVDHNLPFLYSLLSTLNLSLC